MLHPLPQVAATRGIRGMEVPEARGGGTGALLLKARGKTYVYMGAGGGGGFGGTRCLDAFYRETNKESTCLGLAFFDTYPEHT